MYLTEAFDKYIYIYILYKSVFSDLVIEKIALISISKFDMNNDMYDVKYICSFV